jgi:hypothetical protein
VTTKKVYEGRDKQMKQYWLPVGTLTQLPPTQERDESYILELNMFPETKFYLFPQEPPEPGSKG